MKKLFYLFFFVSSVSLGQESDELLKALFDDEPIVEKSLLPDKMIYTQSVLWGKNGLFRKMGISKLSIDQREK